MCLYLALAPVARDFPHISKDRKKLRFKLWFHLGLNSQTFGSDRPSEIFKYYFLQHFVGFFMVRMMALNFFFVAVFNCHLTIHFLRHKNIKTRLSFFAHQTDKNCPACLSRLINGVCALRHA
jgi:hypothetical protein